jgi:hypothetical protein
MVDALEASIAALAAKQFGYAPENSCLLSDWVGARPSIGWRLDG